MAVLGNIWDGRARHSLRAGCHSGQEAVRAGLGKSECVLVHNNGAHGVTRPTTQCPLSVMGDFIYFAANASSPLRWRSKHNSIMRSILILLTLSLALVTGVHAQDNPFEQATQQSYAGRFRADGVELHLLPEAGRWKGTVLIKDKAFTIDADQKSGGLEGRYSDGNQEWPFTAAPQGDTLQWAAGAIHLSLQRRQLPKMEGGWGSSRVRIVFDAGSGGRTGRIKFNGQQFTFAAEEKAGDLAGVFKNGEKSYAFTVANEPQNLVFTTGSFTEIIAPLPRQFELRLTVTTAVPAKFYSFKTNGSPMNGVNGKYILPPDQPYNIEISAYLNEPFKTNVTFAAYEEGTWQVALQKKQISPLGDNHEWQNSLGMKFVAVPGTQVLFGIWDVRVQDYRTYAEANSGVDKEWKQPGFAQGDTHPVVEVSWNDAKAFCQWLTEQERADGIISSSQSYRLPTDAEWSVAVGLAGEAGSTPSEKDCKIKGVYPWGSSWPPPSGAGNYAPSMGVDNFANTSPVGSFAANQYGLYDMGGNVWQWCEDWYDGDQKYRVQRGASWDYSFSRGLLSSYRDGCTPDGRNNRDGFRCVLVVDGASAAR